MRLLRFASSFVPGLLLLGCAHAPAAAPVKPPPPMNDYVTVLPDVSVSRTALEEPEQQQARLDPNADVMAEILAIPAGR